MDIKRARLLTAGGILAIICGILAVVFGIYAISILIIDLYKPLSVPQGHLPLEGLEVYLTAILVSVFIVQIIIGFLAILVGRAILKRTRLGWARTGSSTDLVTAGGTLTIAGGILGILFGGLLIMVVQFTGVAYEIMVVATIMVILGIASIIGGIKSLKRKSFSWALTGSICAAICGSILGILALVFIALSKNKFGVFTQGH